MALTPHSRVEALGRSLGLENSMHAATLIEIDGQRSWVEYETVWEEKRGHRLIEEVSVRSLRLYPPLVTMPLSVGAPVDVYEKGGFWWGVLVGQTDTRYQVHFDYTIPALQHGEYDLPDTRVHMDWCRGDMHSTWTFRQDATALRVGDRAELLGGGRGLENSMYPVKLMTVNGQRCWVEHESVLDNGKPLIEEVHVRNVRPCPPVVMLPLVVGDLVDVFYKGAWWRAIVIGQVDSENHVYFDYMISGLQHGIYNFANTRVHMDWRHGTPRSTWTFYQM